MGTTVELRRLETSTERPLQSDPAQFRIVQTVLPLPLSVHERDDA
jgi:hypothetical protein